MIFRRLSMTLLATLTAIAVVPASATCQNASCGCTEVGVDAIYWRPFSAGPFLGQLTDIPASATDATTTECRYARPDYGWGIRAYGRYFIPCSSLFVGAEYSWFQPENSVNIGPLTATQTFSGPSLVLGEGNIFAGKNEVAHHAFDVVAGYCVCCNPCACVSVAGGIQYLSLEDRLSGTATIGSTTQALSECAKFSGVGPIVRWDVRGNLFGCMTVRVAALAGGLVGDRELKSQAIASSGDTVTADNIRSESNTVFVPLLGTELGLGYQVNICGMCWGIEGGYRSRSYFTVLNADLCDGNLQTVTIAGPYVGVSTTF